MELYFDFLKFSIVNTLKLSFNISVYKALRQYMFDKKGKFDSRDVFLD